MRTTLWLTGHSGAGKTTLAQEFLASRPIIVLDGDVIRSGLSRDLGFTEEDRTEQARRVAEMALVLNNQGYDVLVALISPHRSIRAVAKAILGDFYSEVYVSTPLDVCRARDTKGLYARHAVDNFDSSTVLLSVYEPPENPDLVLDLSVLPVEDAAIKLLRLLKSRAFK